MNHRPNSVLPRVRPKLWSAGRSPILRLRSGQAPAATPESCCTYLQVAIPDPIHRILRQRRALVRAIEGLGTIQPSGPFERSPARLPMAAYERRLQGVVALAPA